jgi:hypothetical protein
LLHRSADGTTTVVANTRRFEVNNNPDHGTLYGFPTSATAAQRGSRRRSAGSRTRAKSTRTPTARRGGSTAPSWSPTRAALICSG